MTIEEKVVEILAQLQGLAEPAAELAISAARVDAASGLAYGFCWALLLVPVGLLLRRLWKIKMNYENEVPLGIGRGACCVAALILSIAAMENLFSVWNWVGLIEPKLYLAHQIIERVR